MASGHRPTRFSVASRGAARDVDAMAWNLPRHRRLFRLAFSRCQTAPAPRAPAALGLLAILEPALGGTDTSCGSALTALASAQAGRWLGARRTRHRHARARVAGVLGTQQPEKKRRICQKKKWTRPLDRGRTLLALRDHKQAERAAGEREGRDTSAAASRRTPARAAARTRPAPRPRATPS